MTNENPTSEGPPASNGQHLATISHDGRFWQVFLEFADDPRNPSSYRALLCFSPADNEGEEPLRRTTTIIIESSYEAAIMKAKAFEEHQLQGLLRSVLPDPD